MKRWIFATCALAALAACNKQSTEQSAAETGKVSLTNATPEEVAKQTQAAGAAKLAMKPGRWETKVEILDIDMPGMPAGMAQQMLKSMQAKPVTVTSCLTPEEAKKPSTAMFTGNKASGCTFRKYDLAGSTLDAVMTCPGKPAGGMTMTMHGDFTPDQVVVQSDVNVEGGAGGAGTMHQKGRVTAKFVGACDGSEQK